MKTTEDLSLELAELITNQSDRYTFFDDTKLLKDKATMLLKLSMQKHDLKEMFCVKMLIAAVDGVLACQPTSSD